MVHKNKKGFLLASEVLKIVIGVIAIVFLIYLLFSLYYSNVDSQNKQEAQATIGRMKDIVTRIENKVITGEKMTDISPSGWEMLSYVGNEQKPNLCAGSDCVCICNTPNVIEKVGGTTQIDKCDTDGVCIPVKSLQKFQSFEIQDAKNGGTNIEISKNSNYIEVKNL